MPGLTAPCPNKPERNEANPNKPDLSRTHLNLTHPDETYLEPYLTIGEKDHQSLYSFVSHTATCHNAPQLTKSDPAPPYATATNQIRPRTTSIPSNDRREGLLVFLFYRQPCHIKPTPALPEHDRTGLTRHDLTIPFQSSPHRIITDLALFPSNDRRETPIESLFCR